MTPPPVPQEFIDFFGGRRDCYGSQRLDGRGLLVRENLTEDVVQRHFEGEHRVGVYLVVGDSVRCGCIDLDVDRPDLVVALDRELQGIGLPTVLERSKGKGWHIWLFFSELVKASDVRKCLRSVTQNVWAAGNDAPERLPEVFPKQDVVREREFGNFLFLPHHGGSLKEGRTAFHEITDEGKLGPPESWSPDSVHRVSASTLAKALKDHEGTVVKLSPVATHSTGAQVSPEPDALIRAAIRFARSGDRVLEINGRNDAGFWLARELRDNGIKQDEAERYMLDYCRRVNEEVPNGANGQREPYTVSEARESLRSAFGNPAQTGKTRPPGDEPPDPDLPDIIINSRQPREVANDVMEALLKANSPPEIFQRDGKLVRLGFNEHHKPIIKPMKVDHVRERLIRSANIYRAKVGKNQKQELTHAMPSKDVLEDVLSRGEYDFPALKGLTDAPIARQDGTVCTKAGYDPSTSLYYHPAPNLQIAPIPDSPTHVEIRGAVDKLSEPFRDFPFQDAASEANCYALLLAGVLREAIPGPIPLFIIESPKRGTGKSLVAKLVGRIATGRVGDFIGFHKDTKELKSDRFAVLIRPVLDGAGIHQGPGVTLVPSSRATRAKGSRRAGSAEA